MNRDPQAWARLGRALRSAREHRGLTQDQLAAMASVSARSVVDAEGGKVPRARMPYTLPAIAKALGWPEGAVESVLDGGAAPGAWRDVPAVLGAEQYASIVSNAILRAADHVTAAEIRAATAIALEELRRLGVIEEETPDNSAV